MCVYAHVCLHMCACVVVCLFSVCVCVWVLVPVCMRVFVSVSGVPIKYLRVDVFIHFNGLYKVNKNDVNRLGVFFI